MLSRLFQVDPPSPACARPWQGEANRVIGEHQLNRESSRSHCVFTLSLALEREAGGGGLEDRPSGSGIVSSKISLVDLAGSERVRKTRSEGLVLKEAGHINKSLHILEQVVLAASERGRDHVPYRSCKLTHVLRDSIGGNCRTVLVANVWGEAAQLEETLSTCRWDGWSLTTCEFAGSQVPDSWSCLNSSAPASCSCAHIKAQPITLPCAHPLQVCCPHGADTVRGDAQRGPGRRCKGQAA